jgi:uncharacterized protein YndB with AHSA1/START domain
MQRTGTLKMVAQGDREIVMVRVFHAPRRLVFASWTNPELVKRWLYGPEDWPLIVCEMDLRVGGAHRFQWRHRGGHGEMGMRGVFREIIPHDRIVFTEVWDDNWTHGETLVTNTFVESAGKTTFTQTVLYASREARDLVLKTPMDAGMEISCDRLAGLLESAEFQSAAASGARA